MLLGKQMSIRHIHDKMCLLWNFFTLRGFWLSDILYSDVLVLSVCRSYQRTIKFVVTTGCDVATIHEYSQMQLIYKHHAITLLNFFSGSFNLLIASAHPLSQSVYNLSFQSEAMSHWCSLFLRWEQWGEGNVSVLGVSRGEFVSGSAAVEIPSISPSFLLQSIS